jgi:hypothetical protein
MQENDNHLPATSSQHEKEEGGVQRIFADGAKNFEEGDCFRPSRLKPTELWQLYPYMRKDSFISLVLLEQILAGLDVPMFWLPKETAPVLDRTHDFAELSLSSIAIAVHMALAEREDDGAQHHVQLTVCVDGHNSTTTRLHYRVV